ncbi:MAG: enoyl-CoA hydratase [Betaproteobacteria bacterium]|nr:MAG: enoyl-CoA hydratase [Betaproteobacteria bacterium]
MTGLPTLLSRRYRYIRLEWSSEFSLLRLRTCVKPIQCYSLAAMAELQQVFNDISANPGLVKHYVMTSDVAGVFNFGGDLSLFVLLIRARDLNSLRLYGRRCIDLVWWMETAAQRGVHTTVLVQGDTLGGGLESVLPFHRVIFERSAQAGFPEVLFNLFPGMGAWDFTIRKAGFAVANDMILSGRLYTAEQLHRRSLVDLVVEDGEGEEAIEQVVRSVHPRLRGTLAALQARSLVAPITYESLSARPAAATKARSKRSSGSSSTPPGAKRERGLRGGAKKDPGLPNGVACSNRGSRPAAGMTFRTAPPSPFSEGARGSSALIGYSRPAITS